jgi:hypothetical protein
MDKIKDQIKQLKRQVLIEQLTQYEIRLINNRIKNLESKLKGHL